ncbi:exotoxin beta-grasp domain-containing protein [Staphylococcus schweitzeri]|uniref:exotoxin beta-grasp domain-containing protein n=1 Tax=Staphylococcus schweitzeri TaxID=1654388 RepID=UPI00050248FD|nr:exotoxin beta-grasp domain-containing protein [Staphylococcus schweitzeri]CDR51056.1 exotoxin [Staphylococcus schweitzeri]
MKLKNIAKASLALGILTTGIITTTAQPVKANSTISVISKDTKELSEYYKGPFFEYKNQSGYKDREGYLSFFMPSLEQIDVKLVGNDKQNYNKDVSNVDIFVVREGTDRSGITKSNGGITKTNSRDRVDNVKSVGLSITKPTGHNMATRQSEVYSIEKEEISLKELDFKLRKLLIEKHGLYQTEPKDSKITVTMNNGGYYTFELNKKLQEHRMGDVIDGTKIKEINVELN